ncbi:hypothetical protein D0962_17845 [Leptolyngbyaceae cyanobacterium CCMR0082]|uniref:Uncharacterized protein n=1 Tax=Adonisia turfae CCMR0082 TaxID=2304604 RepID=A0A6M0S838_9CYAN|nr:hypothetical protein [Adonisia turfae]NEZ64628.1 hypothetical protein [Adonisia turfae CCMR0082]
MSDLVEFRNIADEITIRESDGVAIVSIRAAGRLAGRGENALRKHFEGAHLKQGKLTEMLANKGFDAAHLSCFSESGVPDQALGVILKYYAYKAGRWCTARAEHACDQFQEMGIRATCYAAKGLVQINPVSEEKSQQILDRPDVPQIIQAAEGYERFNGSAYAQSYYHQKLAKHYPALAGEPLPAKERASLKSSERLLTPTEIAEELGITCKTTPSPDPKAVNRLLQDLGYQEKIGKKSPWSATEKGDPFSDRKPVSTNSKSDKDQLLWFASILDVLRNALQGDVAA